MSALWQVSLGVAASLAAVWLVLVVLLLLARPEKAMIGEILRILPDVVRLLRRLAADPAVPRGTRVRLWLLFAYLAIPFDLVPDFIPIVGHADDAVIVCLVLRSVVRRAGPEALSRNWLGSERGLAAMRKAAGLPQSAGIS